MHDGLNEWVNKQALMVCARVMLRSSVIRSRGSACLVS
jgi:hypothetical protein